MLHFAAAVAFLSSPPSVSDATPYAAIAAGAQCT